jgi:hypothetical protein
MGVPFAQYVVEPDGTVRPLDEGWSYLPAVKEVAGLKVDEAVAKLTSAAALP